MKATKERLSNSVSQYLVVQVSTDGSLSYKAESAGRQFVAVDAGGTSQRCPCGEPNIKLLNDREHVCVKCGLVTTRDHASAMEILRLGLSLQSLTAVQ
jgi:transposase